MAYEKVGWKDYPDTSTPTNATNLNKMDNQIATNAADIENLENPSTILGMLLDYLHPVGSIYLTTVNTNPGTTLGGTWEAYGASDTYLRLGGNGNGGANSYSLSSANIPQHNHSFTPSGSVGSHTHTVPAHSHGLNSHAHYIPPLSGSTSAARVELWESSKYTGQNPGFYSVSSSATFSATAGSAVGSLAGQHSHTVTTYETWTGGTNIADTALSLAFESGAATPSFTGTAGTTGNYGSATVTAVPITPKYVSVFAWKRIA